MATTSPRADVSGLTLTGRVRTRAATDTYAVLLEATAPVHARDLADQLGLGPTGPLTPGTGDTLTHHLTPTPPQDPPAA
ncbi:hypothetical protein ACIP8Z_00750 [Streptomyces sp. NPDC088553]|uniref:hypothetical protein n=1 Tax=Streptomyces sp. NPDC088553 TaxID=3365864 RepID=UPI00380FCC68